jgi:hypothetical protein
MNHLGSRTMFILRSYTPAPTKFAGLRANCVVVISALLASACATAPYEPASLDSIPFRDRSQTQAMGPVTVRAAVPGPEETLALFDMPLYENGIQPVWLEVDNQTDSQMRYALVGTDPEYFSPQEVAYVHRSGFSKDAKVKINRYFYDNSMPRRIPAGERRSGFIFTHARPGTKSFNVDLFGSSRDNDVSFTFFIDVPGFEPDHSDAYFQELYTAEQIRDVNRDNFRRVLTTADPRTRDQSGEPSGAPINVVVIGEAQDVLQALIRANWVETPRTDSEAASFEEYFDGRIADVVFRTNENDSGGRNEARFWLSRLREDGVPVWLAQVTHNIGRSKGKGKDQLDPDLDDAAAFFLQDIWYGQGLARYGWVQGRGEVTFENVPESSTGADYFTSGYLAVTWLSGPAVSMLDVDALDWDTGPTATAR